MRCVIHAVLRQLKPRYAARIRRRRTACLGVGTQDLHALLPFLSIPILSWLALSQASDVGKVFSSPMEACEMSLAALSLALWPQSVPELKPFSPLVFHVHVWTFPFFLVCVFLHFDFSSWGLKLCAAPQTIWQWSSHPPPRLSASAPHPRCCPLSRWLASYSSPFSLNLSVQALHSTSP